MLIPRVFRFRVDVNGNFRVFQPIWQWFDAAAIFRADEVAQFQSLPYVVPYLLMGVFVGCFSPMGVFVMDPNACFDRIEECIVNEDWYGALEYNQHLKDWLYNCGFAPYGMNKDLAIRVTESYDRMLEPLTEPADA